MTCAGRTINHGGPVHRSDFVVDDRDAGDDTATVISSFSSSSARVSATSSRKKHAMRWPMSSVASSHVCSGSKISTVPL